MYNLHNLLYLLVLLVRKINILSFFILYFLVSNFVNASVIKEIQINGLNSISRGTVLNYLPVEVGDEFNKEVAENSIRELYETNFFFDIVVNFKNDILTLTFVENPVIKYFDIKNFKEDKVLSEKIISDIKQNFNLKPGKIFVRKNLDEMLKNLRNLYEFNAFYETKFETKSDLDTQNRIGVTIFINEGEQALITSMKVEGNNALTSDEILDTFDIGEPDFFLINFFTERDKFNKIKFDTGIESLKAKYFGLGYLDFVFTGKTIKYDRASKTLDIVLNISEGKRYKVRKFTFSGDIEEFKPDILRKMIKVNDGDFFERKKIINNVNDITNFIQNKGYAFARVVSEAKPYENSNLVDVNIEIITDEKIYLDRINISGNHTTQDDVIRRAITQLEGDIFSKKLVEESIRKIKRLGYFSDVRSDITRHSDSSDKTDLQIEVVETKTGEFSIGLSHSNSTGAALNASISQKNILGTGNTLRASFSNSDALSETSLYFSDPYFNNHGHTISYGFYDKTLNAANIDASSYIINESGVSFGYGVPTSSNSSIFGEMKIGSIDLSCGSALKIYETAQCSKSSELDTSFVFTYSQNSLNDFYFPSDGTAITHSATIGLPLGDFEYLSLSSKYSNYTPVLDDKTLKLSSKINIASGYGNDELPFYKRYYGGGASSIRGFDFNSLGPKYANNEPKGGEFSFVGSAAISSKVDILGIDNDNMRLSGFLDAGTISNKVSDIKVNDFRSSLGVQFSWLTPIGPIGLNFAKPIIKKSNDSTETFAFELGSNF